MKKEQQWKVNDVYCFQIKKIWYGLDSLKDMWFVIQIVDEFQYSKRIKIPVAIARIALACEMPSIDQINNYDFIKRCGWGLGLNMFAYRFGLDIKKDEVITDFMKYIGNTEPTFPDNEGVPDSYYREVDFKDMERTLEDNYKEWTVQAEEKERFEKFAVKQVAKWIEEHKEELEKETPRDSCTYVGGKTE